MSGPVERTLAALQAASITLPEGHLVASHPAVVTSAEHLAVLAPLVAAQPALSGRLARNLFLKDKKSRQLYLVSVLHSAAADYKTLGRLLGAKELRMEDAAVMQDKIGVAPGSVSPLAVMNDTKQEVQLVVDSRLAQDDSPILVHPLVNTATLAISWADLTKFAKAHGHDFKVIDLPDAAAPASAAAVAAPKASREEKKAEREEKKASGGGGGGVGGGSVEHEATLGLDKRKHGEFASWYSQVVTRSELIEYYDISGCYPEDHQVLTEAGWYSYRQFRAHPTVRVACPRLSSDPAKRANGQVGGVDFRGAVIVPLYNVNGLVSFRTATVNKGQHHYGSVVTDGSSDDHIDIQVTDDHRMWARLASGNNTVRNPFDWHRADALLNAKSSDRPDAASVSIQLPVHCPDGALADDGVDDDAHVLTLPFVAPLGFVTSAQCYAFLELYGYWLGGGSLNLSNRAVAFTPVKQAEVSWLDTRLARVGLLRLATGGRGCAGYTVHLAAQATVYHVYHPRWWKLFSDQYAHKYQEGDSLSRPRSPTPPPAEDIDSANCFWHWLFKRRFARRRVLRHALMGLAIAHGASADVSEDLQPDDFERGRVYTASTRFRDEVERLAILAGYTAHSTINREAGTTTGANKQGKNLTNKHDLKHDLWCVSFASRGNAFLNSGTEVSWLDRPQGVGVWCVNVDTPEHLIFVRRLVNGVASRPVIMGNCYILRPWSFSMWEAIQRWFDAGIKKLGVKNAYFPLFVSRKALEAEKAHVEGFAPEVAWVTRSGDTELDEPIAVRPTSETIMYPAFKKIRSHRDLPLKLNQWSNVVRWEFKFPTPFIRSREFLWQEGHSAFATKEEADVEVRQILQLYADVYEKLLAVPVTQGRKTEMEKFAGGLYTTTVEAFIPATGRGIQGATSHCLGQNFARMFNIRFQAEQGSARSLVWQNSWGLTTRTLGVMVMVHSDDRGLVLPPMVAPLQIVIIPILRKASRDRERLRVSCQQLCARLQAADIRTELDDRDNNTAGWKFNHWELKGACLRVEVGDRELESGRLLVQRRDRLEKEAALEVKWEDAEQELRQLLVTMQAEMLQRATAERDAQRKQVTDWPSFLLALDGRNAALVPHCETSECEKQIKLRSGEAAVIDQQQEVSSGADGEEKEDSKTEKLTGAAKSLCIPFEQPQLPEGQQCIACSRPAKNWTLFGRSY